MSRTKRLRWWFWGGAGLFTLGLVTAGACADRSTVASSGPDAMRQVELCQSWCTLRPECGQEPLADDDYLDCVNGCMDLRFRGQNEPCSVPAERELSACLKAKNASCDDIRDDPECAQAQYPFSVCIAGPEQWAALNCNEKCLDRDGPPCCDDPD
jgi:hypothetical protein